MRYRKTVRHFDTPGDAHFLTFSCYRRIPLLNRNRTRLWFVEALNNARRKHDFDLWAWVIMPEHVHLLIYPREPKCKLRTILASIKQPVGAKAIRYLRMNAPQFLPRLTVQNRNRTYRRFWQQGPGYDENLDTAEAAHSVIDYIHFNPVRRGLVERPEDWQWSSSMDWEDRYYVGLRVDRTVPRLVLPS